jgi:hypothetical protein
MPPHELMCKKRPIATSRNVKHRHRPKRQLQAEAVASGFKDKPRSYNRVDDLVAQPSGNFEKPVTGTMAGLRRWHRATRAWITMLS